MCFGESTIPGFALFCPTRLNVSDDPSREVPLRSSSDGIPLSCLSTGDLQRLASSTGFRRFASNWVRLIIRLLGLYCLDFSDRSIYPLLWPEPIPHLGLGSSMDFDATLGFPGEGRLTFHHPWTSLSWNVLSIILGALLPCCCLRGRPRWGVCH